jgi:transglutaminase-like putative cysteine protease
MTTFTQFKLQSFVLQLFAFFLLWEWLRPLEQITDTGNLYIFVLFLALCFLLYYFRVRFSIRFLVKLFVIFFFIHGVHYEGPFFSFRWIWQFFADIGTNISSIINAAWWEMTGDFRTLLFFILLWLMSYLMHHWVMKQRRIFFFLVLTLVYITLLDTFSPYDASSAIVRTLLVGLLLLGILYLDRIKWQENVRIDGNMKAKWIVPLVGFIVLSSVLGFFLPKASPKWPDPVPFIQAYAKSGRGEEVSGIQKVGYGKDDSRLGGPFLADDTVVFTTTVREKHYWRVETKDVYTGKGWTVSSIEEKLQFSNNTSVSGIVQWNSPSVNKKEAEATIRFSHRSPVDHIIYPTELDRIIASEDIFYFLDPVTEAITYLTSDSGNSIKLHEYRVVYRIPEFSVEKLKNIQEGTELEADPTFMERYTQLPYTLPDRVRQLAREITKDANNRYDKARAIVDYFKGNPYVYDTVDVAVPGENNDYVDQFLFETKRGYCDNYSTSMVVLLRSLNIPSRWVKGYTEGQYKETIDGNRQVYEITNNNAHSWVEVYFPGIGWVPFEPTKSFSNPFHFVYDLSAASNQSQQSSQPHQNQQPDRKLQEEKDHRSTDKSWLDRFTMEFSWISLLKWLGIVGVILLILLWTRNKWYPRLLILLYKYRRDGEVYFKAYPALLKLLEHYGLKRKQGQTLREYALYVDSFFEIRDMEQLTLSYEKALYRRDNAQAEWEKSVELWENLIKKTVS